MRALTPMGRGLQMQVGGGIELGGGVVVPCLLPGGLTCPGCPRGGTFTTSMRSSPRSFGSRHRGGLVQDRVGSDEPRARHVVALRFRGAGPRPGGGELAVAESRREDDSSGAIRAPCYVKP